MKESKESKEVSQSVPSESEKPLTKVEHTPVREESSEEPDDVGFTHDDFDQEESYMEEEKSRTVLSTIKEEAENSTTHRPSHLSRGKTDLSELPMIIDSSDDEDNSVKKTYNSYFVDGD